MRRSASILGITVVVLSFWTVSIPATASDGCRTDRSGLIVCHESGSTPGGPGVKPPTPPDPAGPRYVYVTTRAPVGECHYWSNRPGGLDAWDPAYDAAVIAANSLPNCPAPVVVDPPRDTAWDVFRSWNLAPPSVTLEPSVHGITGLPTFLATPTPRNINYREILPDSRVLQVRARVSQLRVDWGDGTLVVYHPSGALPYPQGSVTHPYRTKTCPPEYREEHPSGGLCHPTLEFYTIRTTFRWVGEFNVGSGWETLGTLDRTVLTPYDIDELRGVPVPTPEGRFSQQ